MEEREVVGFERVTWLLTAETLIDLPDRRFNWAMIEASELSSHSHRQRPEFRFDSFRSNRRSGAGSMSNARARCFSVIMWD